MKYTEFHRFVKKMGWKVVHSTGGHIFYEKEGHPRSVPVPYHKGEIPEPLRLRIMKEMGLK